ncbi:hypothetical protein [Streptomyces sp. NPDC058424]|uniref:hypothetical protein n=1 Tax=Streptomyces sp. NPDC058424 TaxID=3346491 RepID=UPI0036546E70
MIRSLIERRRARRAAATAAQLSAHFDAQMQAAADIAITAARRELSRRMPTLPLQHMDRERVDVFLDFQARRGLTRHPLTDVRGAAGRTVSDLW